MVSRSLFSGVVFFPPRAGITGKVSAVSFSDEGSGGFLISTKTQVTGG